MMTRPDSTEILSSTRCPTLILVGDEDTVTPPSIAEAMQRAIAGSELTVLPGAGHLSNLENPGAFNATLSRFLDHRI
jgi:3-oxoadipate enol-lactonase